jgi:pyrroline-5-carboxylate reductase
MKIGILGLGKMGEAIASGLRDSAHAKNFEISATTRTGDRSSKIAKRLGIKCHTENERLLEDSDIILLCVKPHQVEKLLKGLAQKFKKNQLLLSICASITTDQLDQWSGGKAAVIRTMPNTPCLIRKGMTVISPGTDVKPAQLDIAKKIFGTLGETAVIEESLMDGATGLSGCGPAYVYLMIESLSEAGVKLGLPRDVSTLLAAQTLSGSAQMVLQRSVHPAELKDEVTTPAGCTIDGLMALEEGKLRVTLIKAVLAAAKRSKSLREKA